MTEVGGTRQEASKRPRISACVLARDEEGRIGACLKSLGSIADEMIVVDNGSSDGTAAVARGLGATVILRPELELDAARNCYLDAAQGDWILVVDCDERLDAAAGSLLVSAAAKSDLRTWGFTLGRYDYSGWGRWAAVPICDSSEI
jgi:glycosyltransferase involved in cell wall biosynthesis